MSVTDDLAAMSDAELRGCIAREVFGIKRIFQSLSDGTPWDGTGPWPMYIPSGKPWRTHSIDAIPLPRYSTDIAAAWLVVEHLGSCCFEINRERVAGIRYDVKVILQPNDLHEPDTGFRAHSASAPRAICLAALWAVRAEERHP